MQYQPYGAPLAPILFLAGIVIVLVSSRKLRTLGRMVVGFLVVAVVLMIAGALLRRGNPELLGLLIAQMAMGAADAIGLLHVISLKRLRRAEADKANNGK